MNWRPGIPLGDTADSYETYEIYDELCTPDGQVVATLACFVWNPTVYYCNALTPAGKRMHFRAGHRAYATTRDWAERVAGLKVDRDLSGRGGIAPRVARPQKQKTRHELEYFTVRIFKSAARLSHSARGFDAGARYSAR